MPAMKETNRRIDLEVEEYTKRITWESKPLWKRVWINFKKWFYRNQPNFEALIVMTVAAVIVICFWYLIAYLISKL